MPVAAPSTPHTYVPDHERVIPFRPGPLGRLGAWSSRHARIVVVIWVILLAGLGAFAPHVERALSGAGWQADGSASVRARQITQTYFHGQSSSALEVVVHATTPVSDARGRAAIARVEKVLAADPRIGTVLAPIPGVSISRDGLTAIVIGGAATDPNNMVRAADDLSGRLAALSSPGLRVTATGSSVLWSDFNAANHAAMMKSEMLSWPVTLAILVLAFGSLVAAGLPLLLTLAGLITAAGLLDLLTRFTPISVWAMNFAMMFALALGIDYALFIVVRFRGAHFGRHRDVEHSIAETMDSAGKAVLFSGLTVLVSLSSVMVVPSPAFRSMAGGIMLAVAFVLGATLTLLPATLGTLDHRVDALSLPWVHAGEHRSVRFARWGEFLWRRPLIMGGLALAALLALATPVIGLKVAMPSIRVVPVNASARVGYSEVQRAFGPGAPGQLQVIVARHDVAAAEAVLRADAGIAATTPVQYATLGRDYALIDAVPRVDPSNPALGVTIDRLRAHLPAGSLVGGAPAENHDLQAALAAKTPVVIGLVMLLGFLLLVVALRALLVAAARGPHQPARHRGRLRRGPADLPERGPARPLALRSPGLPRRVGTGVLLRDDLRDLDGLHGLPALEREGALGALRGPRRRDDQRGGPLGTRDLLGGRGDDRGLLDLLPVRAAPAQGDGRHPRRGGLPRRLPRAPGPPAGAAAPERTRRLVAARVPRPGPASDQFRPRIGPVARRARRYGALVAPTR